METNRKPGYYWVKFTNYGQISDEEQVWEVYYWDSSHWNFPGHDETRNDEDFIATKPIINEPRILNPDEQLPF